jgi:SAM-dependent methyltransferase
VVSSWSADAAEPGSQQEDERLEYDEDYYRFNGQADDRPALRLYARLVARYTAGGPYLDFGCGTGHLVRRLSALGPAAGFETSEYSAGRARLNAPGCPVHTDPDELATAGFGSLTAIHVLEHLDDELAATTLATWRRVLRPGGQALVVMPDPAGRGRALAGDDWMGFADPTHINLKPHAQWRSFLLDHGFTVEREGSDGLWDVPYGRRPALVDAAVHAVPAFTQFVAGRMLLRPGTGESSMFVLRAR